MSRVVLALRTFFQLALPYFQSEDRWRGRALLGGVIAAELGLVYVAVATINWNARFFNALEQRSWDMLGPELVIFCLILAGAVVCGMSSYYFVQTLTIRWRQWITERYIGLWMAAGRHYRLQFVDQSVDNIHLRIGSDVYLFIQRTLELGAAMARDVRMFTIGGGTAQVLRTLVASKMLGWKLPQTRDGYLELETASRAAE